MLASFASMTPLVVMLVVVSATLHAAWNFAARKVSGDIGVVWIGLCLAAAVSIPFALFLANATTWRSLPYIVLTGAINAVYFYAVTRAYEMGDISHVYPIARGTGVAGAGLAGALILREVVSPLAACGILLVCLGIAVLSFRPSSPRHKGDGAAYAFVMGGAIVCAVVVDKLAMRFSQPIVYISGMMSAAAILIAPYVISHHWNECKQAWRKRKNYSAVIGLGSLSSYLLILIAFQIGSLGPIVAFREMSVVIGSLLGIALLKEVFTLRKGLGIVVVATGLVLLKIG